MKAINKVKFSELSQKILIKGKEIAIKEKCRIMKKRLYSLYFERS